MIITALVTSYIAKKFEEKYMKDTIEKIIDKKKKNANKKIKSIVDKIQIEDLEIDTKKKAIKENIIIYLKSNYISFLTLIFNIIAVILLTLVYIKNIGMDIKNLFVNSMIQEKYEMITIILLMTITLYYTIKSIIIIKNDKRKGKIGQSLIRILGFNISIMILSIILWVLNIKNVFISENSYLIVLIYSLMLVYSKSDGIKNERDYDENPVLNKKEKEKKDMELKIRKNEKRKNTKVIFGITGLTIGGAERVLVDLIKQIHTVYDITIYTMYAGGELEQELKATTNVNIKSIFKKPMLEYSIIRRKLNIIYFNLFMNMIYKRDIKNIYDVEIAFLEGPITRMFANKSNAKKITWVHTDIQKYYETEKYGKSKYKKDKKIYSKYDKIIFVSEDNLKTFKKVFKNNKVPKEVIYNFMDAKRIKSKANEFVVTEIEENIPSLVTVARLTHPKGLFRYLKVHKRLIKEGIVHNVYIIGGGEEKEALIEKAKEYGVKKSFRILGKRENPYPYIAKGTYFCLFSYSEGYGIVIDEAKILKKPVLISDTAAREAVKGYSMSEIFENSEEGIYKGLKEILTNGMKKKKQNDKFTVEEINSNKVYQIIDLIDE